MIFLTEDAYKVVRKTYIRHCIKMFMFGILLYSSSKKIKKQEQKIKDLTKEIKELSLKGD